jgi:predicted dehydrogenase
MGKSQSRAKGDRIRLGVIGLGTMGQEHCANLHKVHEVQLTAVCDGYEPNAAKVGSLYAIPSFTDHNQLLHSGLCDAILIATPHPVHFEVAMDVLQAKIHLLCEKPLTETLSTAERLVRTARKKGLAFGVMFQRRLQPVFATAIDWVNSGALGKIRRTTLICPEYRTQAYFNSGKWRGTWTGEGGGVMINQAPHFIDLLIKLGGMPCEVYGRCETRLHQIEVEDVAEAMLRYPDGCSGYLYCSTNEPGTGHMLEIVGDQGKCCIRDGQLSLHRFSEPVPEFTFRSPVVWSQPDCVEEKLLVPPQEWGHYLIVQNFARHLLHGDPLVAPAEEGLKSLELANAIWLSAHLGKAVKLPLNRRSYDAFLNAKRQITR